MVKNIRSESVRMLMVSHILPGKNLGLAQVVSPDRPNGLANADAIPIKISAIVFMIFPFLDLPA